MTQGAHGEGEVLRLLEERAASGAAPRLGIVGGTFDPIHAGHVRMGALARDELALDGVLFMPAGLPSFKRDARLAAGAERLEMARIATRGMERCAVSSREVNRPGVTYTSETLLELSGACPAGTQVFFVMGADSLETLPTWHDAPTIARLATVAVAPRAGCDLCAAQAALDESGLGFRVVVLEGEVADVSSTRVRALLREGRDVSDLVGRPVTDYIARRGLYGPAPAQAGAPDGRALREG